MRAKLRVCASCEWIYSGEPMGECPKCGFGSYSAHYVYGRDAYRHAVTQNPWLDKQVSAYIGILRKEIRTHET